MHCCHQKNKGDLSPHGLWVISSAIVARQSSLRSPQRLRKIPPMLCKMYCQPPRCRHCLQKLLNCPDCWIFWNLGFILFCLTHLPSAHIWHYPYPASYTHFTAGLHQGICYALLRNPPRSFKTYQGAVRGPPQALHWPSQPSLPSSRAKAKTAVNKAFLLETALELQSHGLGENTATPVLSPSKWLLC